MDMYNKPTEKLNDSVARNTTTHRPNSILHLISKNLGLIVISGLIALAIGIGALHQGYVESIAEPIPEAEIETVSMPQT